MERLRPLLHLAPASVAAFLLASCAVGPDFHTPAPPAASAYTSEPIDTTASAPGAAGEAQRVNTGQALPSDWWRVFHSARLDALVASALKESPTVAAASATLRAAQATQSAEAAALFVPGVDAVVSATRQRQPGALFGQPNAPASIYTLYGASVNVSYTLDLFGGSRRTLEHYRSQTDYQRFQLEAARLALSSNLVTAAVSEARLRAEVAARKELVALGKEQLAISERLVAAGVAAVSAQLAEAAQVAADEAAIVPVEKSLVLIRHRLARLAGRAPETTDLPTFSLEELTLPTELPLSVPADLTRQRPDIRSAEAILHSASADIGVVTAGAFPQLTLSGSVGGDSTSFGSLFTPATRAWSAGTNLVQPLFRGGELWQRRKAAIAAYDAAEASYRDTVLAALAEVADALRALEFDARELMAQRQAEAAAADSLELIRRQYAVGAASYLALLDAERQLANAKLNRIEAQAGRYSDTAALYAALGGGWWNAPAAGASTAAQDPPSSNLKVSSP
jgi:NodT family efflux transporter outer membrane factor (OMF) lipoprotein